MRHDYKYAVVYTHFRKLIEEGILVKGDRMPSLLTCTKELGVSKTTAENAYFQLAADGYIISKMRSGYYVTGRGAPGTAAERRIEEARAVKEPAKGEDASARDAEAQAGVRYDLAQRGDDPSTFRFDLWQRYVKNAIRHKNRMATFGEPQGELELREAICEYVRRRRNIYCSPEHIVVGASTQSLLMVLLMLLRETGARTASVPARGFERFMYAFRSQGFDVDIRRKESDVIYVSPSYMTVWGDVMSLSRRYEILEHSKNGHLIIEDDYQNEFVFTKQVCPSLYALSEGEHVVYLGSFSRLLLPSIRISFMILSKELLPAYRRVADLYDQTASKTEQLALCSYLRDDHMYRQIRKLRRTYLMKRNLLRAALELLTDGIEGLTVLRGDCGTEMAVQGRPAQIRLLIERLDANGISCRKMERDPNAEEETLLFSCGVIGTDGLCELNTQLGDPA